MYSENEYFDTPAAQEAKMPAGKRWYQRWWGQLIIIFAAIFLTLFTAVAIYVGKVAILLRSGQVTTEQLFGQGAPALAAANANLFREDDPQKGPFNAKVVIVEFADFTCPACKEDFLVVKKLIDDYGSQVLFVFRDFPLVNDRPLSLIAAVAGNCALEQGKFWEMHDLLFSTNVDLTEEILKTYAIRIGLNSIQFGSCLTSEKYLAEIEQDLKEGYDAGARATPTFFINGTKVEGALPFAVFEKIITTELSKN
jgi:protein-disulfide isomerase